MSTKKNIFPDFESEEQEAEYWDKHSPLDQIVKPDMEEIQVKNGKDRPVTIRLDSQTRVRLNTLAAAQGMGPSTLARRIIQQVLENEGNIKNKLDSGKLVRVLPDDFPQVNEAKAAFSHLKSATGDVDKSSLLIVQGGKKELDDFSAHLLERLLANLGIRVTTSDQFENQKKRNKQTKH
jgi:hypothetical protein